MPEMYDDGGLSLLGDQSRRAIFELLARRPSPVGELARLLPISREAVSQHLKALKDVGLVTDRREGTRRIYRVDPSAVQRIRTYLTGVWIDALSTALRFPQPAHTPQGHRDADHRPVTQEIPPAPEVNDPTEVPDHAHWQEVADVVQPVFEGPPGGHGAHREPTEAAMVTRGDEQVSLKPVTA